MTQGETMNLENLIKRNGGRLKFRTVWKELGHDKPGRPMTQRKCEFCDYREMAEDQIVETWITQRGKLKSIAWAWIGPECKAKVRSMTQGKRVI